MSDHQHSMIELRCRGRLTLADGIVLVTWLGLKRAAEFVTTVDPWMYVDEDKPASVKVYPYLQSAIDKASLVGRNFGNFTDESMSAYLLSPLLIGKVNFSGGLCL